MKKIGIISDTHSYWDPRYVEHFKDCDEIWHAGDIGNEQVALRLAQLVPTFRAVYGNADGGLLRRDYKALEIFETEGVKVVMTHIGGYPGRYAPGIKSRLELSRPKIFVCGQGHPRPPAGRAHHQSRRGRQARLAARAHTCHP